MTRDEIAQAMQDSAGADWGTEAHFQKFAALVAAAEREACARVCETLKITRADGEPIRVDGDWCADAIRARSKP